jgi:hypothetical protein
MTPGERTLRARAAAYEMHAKHGSQKAAIRGQAALLAKFERQVDPEGRLTPEERRRRAMHALVDPSDAVLLRGPGVRGLAKVSNAARLGQDSEEPFEPARERHDDQPAGPRHDPPMGMRDAARQKDQAARANMELLVAALVDVLTLDDVVHLVLVTVHVSRGVQQRSTFLEHGERPARRLRRRADDDRRPAEDYAFALAWPSGERTRLSGHGPTLDVVPVTSKTRRPA